MAIIISKKGKDAKKIDKSNFEKEDYLQRYIYDNPESIPLYDIKEDVRLLILAREFSTDSGPLDAIGIDKDGVIYLIETKLYKNPDKRLVVAQVLDYGASLWRNFTDFGEFLRKIDNEVNKKFNISLNQKLKDFFGISDEEIPILLDNTKRNFNDGSFKFIVLMDKLHEHLKDLIVFINQNSQFDIFAVELEYYKHEDYEIMIPKLFGAEVKKDISVASSKRKIWNEEDFIKQTREKLGNNAKKIIELYEYFKEGADKINWGTGAVNGSFAPVFNKICKGTSPFSIYSNGNLFIKFKWLTEYLSDEIVKKYLKIFVEELKKATSIEIPKDCLNKEFTILGQDFLDNYDGVVKAIKKVIEND